MEGRMTVCNMSIEGGARAGMIAPDDTTFNYLLAVPSLRKARTGMPPSHAGSKLPTDEGAIFDREITIDGDALDPMITWGTNPGMGVSINGAIPDPSSIADPMEREPSQSSRLYGSRSGKPILGHPVNVVFIGSCTNSRITDLRAAAAVLKGRKVNPNVRVMVVPGSMEVKRQAIAEGLPDIFRAAGCDYREPGCSMCIAMNGDQLSPANTAFPPVTATSKAGRAKAAGRSSLRPLTAAATALTGVVTDVRTIL